MGRKLLKLTVGDLFAIPLPDGDRVIGQIVASIEELGSVGCAIFPLKLSVAEHVPLLSNPISVLLVTPDLLQRGYWPILENRPVSVSPTHFLWENHRHNLWVGAKIYGSGIVRQLVEAYHGFSPWDSMADPDYFSKLLVSGASMPSTAHAAGG